MRHEEDREFFHKLVNVLSVAQGRARILSRMLLDEKQPLQREELQKRADKLVKTLDEMVALIHFQKALQIAEESEPEYTSQP